MTSAVKTAYPTTNHPNECDFLFNLVFSAQTSVYPPIVIEQRSSTSLLMANPVDNETTWWTPFFKEHESDRDRYWSVPSVEPVIVLAPNSGFCNRLEFMCKAIKYAATMKRNVYHMWDGTYHKRLFPHEQQISDRPFEYFFDSPLKAFNPDEHKVSICYSHWMPGQFWFESHSYGSKRLCITDLRPDKAIPSRPVNESFLIQGHVDTPITPSEQFELYKTHFKPTALFLNQLTSFEEPVVGVHVRKVDFYFYYKDAFVPDELIYKWLAGFNAPVVVFSDDKTFQAEARSRLKRSVSCAFEQKAHPAEDLAFLEFLTLSRCTVLYGTLHSSFSKQASVYGNILHTPITEELVTSRPPDSPVDLRVTLGCATGLTGMNRTIGDSTGSRKSTWLVCMSDNRPLERCVESADYNSLVAAINQEYCNKHNYDFIYFRPYLNRVDNYSVYNCLDPLSKEERHASWAKLLTMSRALEMGYEHVVYIDSDCIFKTFEQSLEDYVKPYGDKDVVFMNNKPWSETLPCSGFFVCKVGPGAKQFLRDWYSVSIPYRNKNHAWEQDGLWSIYTKYNLAITDGWMFRETEGQFLRHIGKNDHALRIPYFKRFLESKQISFSTCVSKIHTVEYNTNVSPLPCAPETVVVAILAKNKTAVLPMYLECLLRQTLPKTQIHLYIRTNDNTDATETILRTFVKEHGAKYASVFFDASSVSDALKAYKPHEWNSMRFAILGKLRQDSVDYAKAKGAHYFVADCDNFIVPVTLERMMEQKMLGIVAPMLVTKTAYSNFHYDVDKNGYLKDHPNYRKVLNRQLLGCVEVAVVHCTYFVANHLLYYVSYDDKSARYEYAIFSDVLRKCKIPQYLDNRQYYGFLTFADTEAEFGEDLEKHYMSHIEKYF
jgi:hypothetical protein